MIFKSKRFVAAAVLLLVVAIGLTVTAIVMAAPKYKTLKAVANVEEGRKLKDFKGSQLYFHNGTFSFKVVYNCNNIFVGIGTYKKVKKTYVFQYQDMYRIREDGTLQHDPYYYNWAPDPGYKVTKKGIEIRTPDNQLYYFK
jgi:hypothetical protein